MSRACSKRSERVLCGAAVITGDHQVEVVMRSRLLVQQGIDAPPSVHPHPDMAGGAAAEDFLDIGAG